ncbi:MAG: hypothetical protein EBQ85_10150 [Proteobacteria bacterium]|nr:hypothetical protein [Pseudomonadota bacterium]
MEPSSTRSIRADLSGAPGLKMLLDTNSWIFKMSEKVLAPAVLLELCMKHIYFEGDHKQLGSYLLTDG